MCANTALTVYVCVFVWICVFIDAINSFIGMQHYPVTVHTVEDHSNGPPFLFIPTWSFLSHCFFSGCLVVEHKKWYIVVECHTMRSSHFYHHVFILITNNKILFHVCDCSIFGNVVVYIDNQLCKVKQWI